MRQAHPKSDFDPSALGADGAAGSEPFVAAVTDFHLTNPIARASKTMAECAKLAAKSSATQVAAE